MRLDGEAVHPTSSGLSQTSPRAIRQLYGASVWFPRGVEGSIPLLHTFRCSEKTPVTNIVHLPTQWKPSPMEPDEFNTYCRLGTYGEGVTLTVQGQKACSDMGSRSRTDRCLPAVW